MLRDLITRLRRPGLLHPVLALFLLFSLTQDVGHNHDEGSTGSSAQQCYVCHLSVDLGPAAGTVVPDIQPSLSTRTFLESPRDLLRGVLAAYDARGPPQLLI